MLKISTVSYQEKSMDNYNNNGYDNGYNNNDNRNNNHNNNNNNKKWYKSIIINIPCIICV